MSSICRPKKKGIQRCLPRFKAWGRLTVSDVVAIAEIPDQLREQPELLCGCIAGAERVDRIRDLLNEVGFEAVRIKLKSYSRELVSEWYPGTGVEKYVSSADIEAVKPLR